MTAEEHEQFDRACAEEFTQTTREQEEASYDIEPEKKRRINNNYKAIIHNTEVLSKWQIG